MFIYDGGDRDGYSWSVDSYLLSEASLPDVLPAESCWSLPVVQRTKRTTADSDSGFDVAWIVGLDVLNIERS